MNDKTSSTASAGGEFLSFTLGAEHYGVDILKVQEIRGYDAVTRVPDAPDYIKGVINLRGIVLPIIDLGARFGLATAEPTARHVIMVAHIGSRLVGLLVDAVSDIVQLTDSTIQPTPAVASDHVKTFVQGIFAVEGGRMISLIDLNHVLPAESEAEAA